MSFYECETEALELIEAATDGVELVVVGFSGGKDGSVSDHLVSRVRQAGPCYQAHISGPKNCYFHLASIIDLHGLAFGRSAHLLKGFPPRAGFSGAMVSDSQRLYPATPTGVQTNLAAMLILKLQFRACSMSPGCTGFPQLQFSQSL